MSLLRKIGDSGFRAGSALKSCRVSDLKFRIIEWIFGLATTLAALTFSIPAFAQSCAMCYTSAAAAKAGAIQALRSGILILLVPPLLMMAAIVVVIYRYRNRFNIPASWTVECDREMEEMLRGLEPAGDQGCEKKNHQTSVITFQ